MNEKVEIAMEQIRSSLLAQNSDIELLKTTELGVVHVRLSGECCTGRLKRLMTILDIEKTVKKAVPGIKLVIET